METLANGETPDLMANFELLEMLQESTKSREGKKTRSRMKHRDWIESKVLDYLKNSDCTKLDAQRAPELVERLRSEKRDGFGLTDAEALQVLNLAPSESVEIHLMIEDLPSRMTDEKQERLLNFVGSFRKEEQETLPNEDTGDAIEEIYEEEVLTNGHSEETDQKIPAKAEFS